MRGIGLPVDVDLIPIQRATIQLLNEYLFFLIHQHLYVLYLVFLTVSICNFFKHCIVLMIHG